MAKTLSWGKKEKTLRRATEEDPSPRMERTIDYKAFKLHNIQ